MEQVKYLLHFLIFLEMVLSDLTARFKNEPLKLNNNSGPTTTI